MAKGVLDPWLIAGSSLYWSAVVLSFTFADVSTSPAANPSYTAASYAWVALLICGIHLCRRLLVKRRLRQATAACMLAIIAIYVVGTSATQPGSLASLALSAIYLVSVAFQMVLWGFAYASFDKERACQNVCCTVLVVALIVLSVSLASTMLELEFVTQALNLASLAIVAAGKVYFSNRRHEPEPNRGARTLAPFVLTRVAFGLTIGLCMQLPGLTTIRDGEPGLILLSLALGTGMLAICLGARTRLSAFMPTVLVAALCLLFIPYLDGGTKALVACSAGYVWLAWATMSAAQLSELKETCGMSEVALCVLEKGLLSLSIVVGAGAFALAGIMGVPAPDGPADSVVVVGLVATLVLLAAYVMARLVDDRREDEYARRLRSGARREAEDLYGRLAAEHRLSERETQIMALLAEGYSRTYIRDSLGISEGTVKAHVAHLYQKLDIHRKDELLEMVETRRG